VFKLQSDSITTQGDEGIKQNDNMETEKTAARSDAEKKAMDHSGYSEKLMDLHVNNQSGNPKSTGDIKSRKKASVFQAKKEQVLLDKKAA
jgi:hypothetical protein